jgi:tight adherence protein C
MANFFEELYRNPTIVIAVLFCVCFLALAATFVTPYLEKAAMERRRKSVSTEREQIRARERAKLTTDSIKGKGQLRAKENLSVKKIVDQLNLRKALVDDKTVDRLRAAGYRSQSALNTFLVARFALPIVFFLFANIYIFGMGQLADKTLMIRILVICVISFIGFYTPNFFVSNRMAKRQLSIKRAWPDALDLMLICVESGISMELAFKRVADEIAAQSSELAEEVILTVAELSFLPDRKVALENLGNRTQIDQVKGVMTALIQSERYGTPIALALRTMAQESRDIRMNEAEQKAAALPPKLTVPMILFFLPVLLAVLMGPAGIQVSDTMAGKQTYTR